MNKFHCLAILALASCPLLADAQITWQGTVNNDLFEDGNWDFTNAENGVTTISPDVAVSSAVEIPSGFTISTSVANFSSLRMDNGFAMDITGSSIEFTASSGLRGIIGAGTSTFNLLGGSLITAQFVAEGATVNVDGTSELTLKGAGDPINSTDELSLINLSPGGKLTMPTLANFTDKAEFIRVGGVSYFDDPTILSFSGTTATAVPESSVFAFVAGVLAVSSVVLRRRR